LGVTLGSLIHKIRKSQKVLKKSESNLSVLSSYLELMNNAVSIKDVAEKSVLAFKKFFNLDLVFYLNEKDGSQLNTRAFGNKALYNEKEFSIAAWAFDNKQMAGKFSATLPNAELRYYPLCIGENNIGVAGIRFISGSKPNHDQLMLINALIAQLTNTLMREINIDKIKVIEKNRIS
jgi:two-component system, OmpR family, sensor histidine kinase KdpD